MEQELVKILHKNKLESNIDSIREVLNEMCCTNNQSLANIETLILSRQLDDLIVEYMRL